MLRAYRSPYHKTLFILGYKVYGIDKLTYAANYQFLDELQQHKGFTFKKADIATLEYLPDCDYIINTAAESHVGNSIVLSLIHI